MGAYCEDQWRGVGGGLGSVAGREHFNVRELGHQGLQWRFTGKRLIPSRGGKVPLLEGGTQRNAAWRCLFVAGLRWTPLDSDPDDLELLRRRRNHNDQLT